MYSINPMATMFSSLTMIAILSCLVIVWVLGVIAKWRIFKKAGESAWKSIIPIYSDYIFYKIVWKPSMFWVTLVLTVIIEILSLITSVGAYLYLGSMGIPYGYNMETSALVSMGTAIDYGVLLALSLIQMIFSVVLIIISVKLCIKTAHSFGKGGGFAVGLFFLNFIFLLILGFGNAQYKGKNEQDARI